IGASISSLPPRSLVRSRTGGLAGCSETLHTRASRRGSGFRSTPSAPRRNGPSGAFSAAARVSRGRSSTFRTAPLRRVSATSRWVLPSSSGMAAVRWRQRELVGLAERALDTAAGETQATVTRERSLVSRFAHSVPTQATAVEDVDVTFLCVRDGCTGSARTNRFDGNALGDAAGRAAGAAEAAAREGRGD